MKSAPKISMVLLLIELLCSCGPKEPAPAECVEPNQVYMNEMDYSGCALMPRSQNTICSKEPGIVKPVLPLSRQAHRDYLSANTAMALAQPTLEVFLENELGQAILGASLILLDSKLKITQLKPFITTSNQASYFSSLEHSGTFLLKIDAQGFQGVTLDVQIENKGTSCAGPKSNEVKVRLKQVVCPAVYEPICASQFPFSADPPETYGNTCQAKINQARILHEGGCQNQNGLCSLTLLPSREVCGQPLQFCPPGLICAAVMPNPKTYPSLCSMELENANLLSFGVCPQ